MTTVEFFDDLITIGEAAGILGVSFSTAYRRVTDGVAAGELTGRMVAGTWLTLRSEIEDIVRSKALADLGRLS